MCACEQNIAIKLQQKQKYNVYHLKQWNISPPFTTKEHIIGHLKRKSLNYRRTFSLFPFVFFSFKYFYNFIIHKTLGLPTGNERLKSVFYGKTLAERRVNKV